MTYSYTTTVRLPDRHREFLTESDINLSAHVRDLLDDLEREWETKECENSGCSNELGIDYGRIHGNSQPGQEMALGSSEEIILCRECINELVDSMKAV